MEGQFTCKRSFYIHELLESEHKYVSDLKRLIEGLKSNTTSSDNIGNLRRNLEQMQRAHCEFLSSLEKNVQVDKLQSYESSLVCTPEVSFIEHSQKIIDASASFLQNFDEYQAALSNTAPLLAQECIKPVQRLCKYHLLMESIVKGTKDQSNPILLEALHLSKKIAESVNEIRREAEIRREERRLAVSFPDLIENKGHLHLFCTQITIFENNNERACRSLHLFDNYIVIDVEQLDKRDYIPVQGIDAVENVTRVERHAIKLKMKHKIHSQAPFILIKYTNEDTRATWMQNIVELIKRADNLRQSAFRVPPYPSVLMRESLNQ